MGLLNVIRRMALREQLPIREIATAIGVQLIEHHRRKVRFFSTIELVDALKQEKARGKAGQIA